jgi:hypothetical protein
MKISKSNIFYIISSYFLLFAFVGTLFNVFTMSMAWSVSIFIVLWCSYWFIRYCIDMYRFSLELMDDIIEKLKNL